MKKIKEEQVTENLIARFIKSYANNKEVGEAIEGLIAQGYKDIEFKMSLCSMPRFADGVSRVGIYTDIFYADLSESNVINCLRLSKSVSLRDKPTQPTQFILLYNYLFEEPDFYFKSDTVKVKI